MTATVPFKVAWFMGKAESEVVPAIFETARRFGVEIEYDYLTGSVVVLGGATWQRDAFWEELGNRAKDMTQTKSGQLAGWVV